MPLLSPHHRDRYRVLTKPDGGQMFLRIRLRPHAPDTLRQSAAQKQRHALPVPVDLMPEREELLLALRSPEEDMRSVSLRLFSLVKPNSSFVIILQGICELCLRR